MSPRSLARIFLLILAAFALLSAACSITTDDLANVTETADGLAAAATNPPSPIDGSARATEVPATTAPSSEAPSTAAPAPQLVADAGSDGAGDSYFPTYGNGGYDVESYDLDLNWDDNDRSIQGQATITLTATQRLARFNLDLVGLEVQTIEVDGEGAAFQRAQGELIITPAAPIELDEVASVVIQYSGTPTQLATPGSPFSYGWFDLGDAIVVAGEPEGAAGWYPVNDHPTDKAIYRITLTADADLIVAANGTQRSVTDNGDTKTWVYESEHPQASYLTTLVIGDFVRHDGDPSATGVPVRHYFHRTLVEESIATMERTGLMIDAFEERFGPYPFENYGAIVVNEPLGFALETQTLSVFGSDLVDLSASREDIVAHELAHQWFGNHVSVGDWSDIWLNEGFATYGEYLWNEASEPGYDIDQAIRDDYEQLNFLLNTPPGAPGADDLFAASVYLRGGFTLHALRTTIGDDLFFQVITTYVEEYGGANARTEDFITLTEEISGQDLGEFFDAWLYDELVPALPR